MATKTGHTKEHIKAEIVEQKLRYVSLYDDRGNQLMPWNSNKVTGTAAVDKIFLRLKSASMPDGIYVIHARDAHNSQHQLTWDYVKGRGVPLADNPRQPVNGNGAPSGMGIGFDKFMEMTNTINELKMEIHGLKIDKANLQATVIRLENEIAEMEEEWEDAGETMAEGEGKEKIGDVVKESLKTVADGIEKVMLARHGSAQPAQQEQGVPIKAFNEFVAGYNENMKAIQEALNHLMKDSDGAEEDSNGSGGGDQA